MYRNDIFNLVAGPACFPVQSAAYKKVRISVVVTLLQFFLWPNLSSRIYTQGTPWEKNRAVVGPSRT